MNKRFNRGLFIFRRDLRLYDNKTLIEAIENCREVFLIFIFDPRQIDRNSYYSNNAFDFMRKSLLDLEKEIEKKGGKLYYFYSYPENVLEEFIEKENINVVYFNKDYTPFSLKRDESIEQKAKGKNIEVISLDDAVLNDPLKVRKLDGGLYTKFTPYYKRAYINSIELDREIPDDFKFANLSIMKSDEVDDIFSREYNSKRKVYGGREEGLELLNNLESLDYSRRDFPYEDLTSHLSAHLKFGTLSIRETFRKAKEVFGRNSTFVSQLYWRDFHVQIAYNFNYVFGGSFFKVYDNIKWENNLDLFEKWKEGKTGYPIVDAGMRQLNETGWMHNRVRMIVASFLVKDLLIDWRWGEKYFASKLVDYDPMLNNGNWQWAASTGCDAQPYFRIFNPWRQQERFDPQAKYIKKWVEELRDVNVSDIHKGNLSDVEGYPRPIVDHNERKEYAKDLFKNSKY